MDIVLDWLATPRGQITGLMLACLVIPTVSIAWIWVRDEVHRHAH
jgi:hypothetical protein